MKHKHNLIIYFEADDFEHLKTLRRRNDGDYLVLPGVRLEDAWLELTDSVARLHLSYRKSKPNGIPHQRRTRDVITFPSGAVGVGWLAVILTDADEYLHARQYWPGGYRAVAVSS